MLPNLGADSYLFRYKVVFHPALALRYRLMALAFPLYDSFHILVTRFGYPERGLAIVPGFGPATGTHQWVYSVRSYARRALDSLSDFSL